jgi:DNA-binding NarL/FixJ family response regulator
MSEKAKSVVIVEDQKPQRENLIKTLTQYNFEAVAGSTIAGTLELLQRRKDDAAVIILDMELSKFPDYKAYTAGEGAMTGIGLAKKLLRESSLQRPEILINSIFADNVEYYKQAIEAGASAYSRKGVDSDRRKFVSVIQALTLKYSFQPHRNEAEIARLTEGHASSFELLDYFCRHKLARELDLCLASAPLVLLFRTKEAAAGSSGTQNPISVYSNVNGVPDAADFDYATLYQRIVNQRKLDKPSLYSIYTPEADLFAAGKTDKLKEFLFIDFVNVAEVEIALGILTPFPKRDALGEYPFSTESLVESLLKYASPVLETFVQKLLFRWRERQSTRIESVKTSVGLSANVQRRLGPLVRDQRLAISEEAAVPLGGLKQLSADLTEYNRTLSALLEGGPPVDRVAEGSTRLSDVVREIKTEYDRLGYFDDISFTVTADCLVPTVRYYFSQALRALVAWAFQRRAEVAAGEKQFVQIRCAVQGNWLELYFQENSQRLSKRVREAYLFEPMSPLQVAQAIIELACHGKLVDVTDELQTKRGHLLKIRLLQN